MAAPNATRAGLPLPAPPPHPARRRPPHHLPGHPPHPRRRLQAHSLPARAPPRAPRLLPLPPMARGAQPPPPRSHLQRHLRILFRTRRCTRTVRDRLYSWLVLCFRSEGRPLPERPPGIPSRHPPYGWVRGRRRRRAAPASPTHPRPAAGAPERYGRSSRRGRSKPIPSPPQGLQSTAGGPPAASRACGPFGTALRAALDAAAPRGAATAGGGWSKDGEGSGAGPQRCPICAAWSVATGGRRATCRRCLATSHTTTDTHPRWTE
ncbi:hypothetical protein HRbin32_01304 [bacterium HR32]|nr:hypothetical protein HRbin32_01304 [bacterium HR32]